MGKSKVVVGKAITLHCVAEREIMHSRTFAEQFYYFASNIYRKMMQFA